MRDYRAIVHQLRAKADSTAFPEEAMNLRARANELEAKYLAPKPAPGHRAPGPMKGNATYFDSGPMTAHGFGPEVHVDR